VARWQSARQKKQNDDHVRFSGSFLIVLFILAGVLLVFDRPDNRAPALSALRAAFNDAAVPLLEIAAQPLRGVNNIAPWWRRQIELAEDNRAIREELAELSAWRDAALNLGEQVRRQQEILNLEMSAPRSRVTAWTVADSGGPFVRARLVGVGQEHGVEPGYPAVNVYGLVGRTVNVGRRSSRILLLTDLNSRVSVMADRSNARAMMVGDNSEFPRLDYVGRAPDLRDGDRIVTSGDDNVLPRGLPVGDAVRGRDGVWRVALYSDAAPLDLVWISPFSPVRAPEADPAERPFFLAAQNEPPLIIRTLDDAIALLAASRPVSSDEGEVSIVALESPGTARSELAETEGESASDQAEAPAASPEPAPSIIEEDDIPPGPGPGAEAPDPEPAASSDLPQARFFTPSQARTADEDDDEDDDEADDGEGSR
jgi:rod shape-determining protein MreC